MAKTALHNLNAGMVLDHSVMIGLSAVDLSKCISLIRMHDKKSLFVVDNADIFFTPASLVSLMTNKDGRYVVVNEALGGFFTQQQVEALTGANKVAGAIEGLAVFDQEQEHDDNDVIVNLGVKPYEFAAVPAGWSVGTHMSLGATKIKRKIKTPQGDGTMFFMSPKDFEKLWLWASQAWAGIIKGEVPVKFQTGLGVKSAMAEPNKIVMGGNIIYRYEIEQVAKYRGWAVPDAVKVAA